MFIPDPDFYPSRILNPKTATKERDEKNLLYLFCSHKFHKIKNYFIFEVLKKNIWVSFQIIIDLFTHKFVISSKNMGLGFGIPDPGKKPM
jgi:hypothetical protein